ncbi:DUF4352 domain-containing protein [Nocardiopsis sp. FIRDI 009]|uniref:DUF4352 domain-containing protein n=1 Tax=Nocardiopsis sp. FIRDI 009 TaxID=714197 RepID=UPI001E5FAA6D|nr:DUF4352 domain-containing protein [Nocardiopsis sp. FIRDI 009]
MSYPPQQPPYGPPQPPPKQGMSTGAKIGIFGCGGCLVLVVIGFVLLFALGLVASSEDGTAASSPSDSADSSDQAAEEPADDTAEEPAADSEVTMTATNAGTVGDTIDDTVYTAIDIEIVNNSDEAIDVNPINFSVVLADGTVVSDWADTIFADIEQLDVVTLQPGQRTSGQIAVVGEVEVASVEMGDLLGLGDPVVADVQ